MAEGLVEIPRKAWRLHDRGHVIAKCPGCGKEGTLAAGVHRVDTDGRVLPSMECPHDGCMFHAFVRLVGWSPVGLEG